MWHTCGMIAAASVMRYAYIYSLGISKIILFTFDTPHTGKTLLMFHMDQAIQTPDETRDVSNITIKVDILFEVNQSNSINHKFGPVTFASPFKNATTA